MNIFGEGFPKEIVKQIDLRQLVHGNGYLNERTIDSHLYKNANSAWCKLVSSTEIVNSKALVNTNIGSLGYNRNEDELARKFVLFNGTSTQGFPNDREGIAFGRTNAYNSWGKDSADFGFRPMAGITSVSIRHKNNGSIRTATVNIKAWDKISFEIIDVLYLRLGFSVLLEWGNSMYYDNKTGLLIKNPNSSLAEKFLDGDVTYYDFLKIIKNQRLATFGNYDALFGKVTNFHWSYQPDGSYDIILDLVSAGDILESFKVKGNAIKNVPDSTISNESVGLDYYDIDKVLITYASTNDLAYFLHKKQIELQTKGYQPSIEKTAFKTPYVLWYEDTDGSKSGEKGKVGEIVRTFPDIDYSGGITNYYIRLGDLLKFIQDEILYKIKNAGTQESKFLYIDYDTKSNLMHAPDQLMSYDPRVCMVRRFVYFEKADTTPPDEVLKKFADKNGKYIIYNPDTPDTIVNPNDSDKPWEITVTNTGTVVDKTNPSTLDYWSKIKDEISDVWDYTKIVVGSALHIDALYISGITDLAAKQTADDAAAKAAAANAAIGKDGTYDRVDFDPSKEYFSHPYGGATITYVDKEYINKFIDPELDEVGRIMNIYINFRFIITKLQELTDTDTNSVGLYNFLKELVSNINSSFGGYSKLDLWIDETSNTLKIIDQNPLPSVNGVLQHLQKQGVEVDTSLAFFNVNRYYNAKTKDGEDLITAGFIRDFQFNTELTPAYSTMIQVSSTSRGNVQGENNTALSKLNLGLRDRFKEEINGGGQEVKPNNEAKNIVANYQDALAEYTNFTKNLSLYLGHIYDNIFIDEEIDDNKSTFTVQQKLYKKFTQAKNEYWYLDSKKHDLTKFQPGTGFIPFNLSLTMDGLSGMKIGSKFFIDSSYLPSNYPNTVDFLIKSINHEIKDNQWTTTLESFCVAQGNNISNKTIDLKSDVIDNATGPEKDEVVNVAGLDTWTKDGGFWTYLSWQQGSYGAALHYIFASKGVNSSIVKYSQKKKNVTIDFFLGNWPSKYKSSVNNIGVEDVKKLFNKGVSDDEIKKNNQILASAFLNVWTQKWEKGTKNAFSTIDSNGTDRRGHKYSDLKKLFKDNATSSITYDILVKFAYIENGLQSDTCTGNNCTNPKYWGMFQMNKKNEKFRKVLDPAIIESYKVTSDPNDTYNSKNINKTHTDFDSFKLIPKVVPLIDAAFKSFKEYSGYPG